MIQEFIEIWEARKGEIEAKFRISHPETYKEIVQSVVGILEGENLCNTPDPSRIHEIDDGDYQGTLVYVIGETGYQPRAYWTVLVSYGSCSGCDTLMSIRDYEDDAPTEQQVKDYMTLALHILQNIKEC